MFSAPCLCPAFRSFSLPLLSLRAVQTPYPAQNAGGPRNDFLTKRAAWLIFQLLGRRTQDHRLRRQQSAPTRTNSGDRRHGRDRTRRADDPGPSTNVGYIHRREKRYDSTAAAAADTGIRPATPQRMPHVRPPGGRHHHCDVIFLGAVGLPGWIFSQRWQRGHAGSSCSAMEADWHDWKHLDRPTDELGAPLPPGGEEAGSRVEGIW